MDENSKNPHSFHLNSPNFTSLPLLKYKNTILDLIKSNQCLILQADTGLGKTTQVPQYLLSDPYFSTHQIYCTQPRKIAAMCVAKRVNEEMQSNKAKSCLNFIEISSIFNYSIVYFSESSFLNYLLTEIYNEVPLKSSKVLILDEAHERNIETDVILALIKFYILKKRKDFKLIITSATLQVETLSNYLNCPILLCQGSAFPVNEIFLNHYDSYFHETVNLTIRVIQGKLSANTNNETILVFLPGYDEINGAKVLISNKIKHKDVEILLLYGHLEQNEQFDIINKQNKRIRVVISTNIAESSLTVPGVTCVIDSGREKVASGGQFKDFRVKFTTKMSAVQRKGRAGRTNPGICYRIYTKQEYDAMELFREPAILRCNIGLLVLKFMKYGILNIESLPLLNHPDHIQTEEANAELLNLNLIQTTTFSTYKLTEIGKFVLELDINPVIGKFLYSAYRDFQCGDEAAMLSAMLLCVDFIFLRYENIENSSDLREQYMFTPGLLELGDFVTCLFVFRQYYSFLCEGCINLTYKCNCAEQRQAWANKFFVFEKRLKSALRLYFEISQKIQKNFQEIFYFSEEEWSKEKQLAELSLTEFGSERYKNVLNSLIVKYKEFYEDFLQNAIISSFFSNLAQYRGDNIIDAGYLSVANKTITVPHPSSQLGRLLFANPPKYVMFYEISVTTNIFMKYITPVNITKVKKICSEWLAKMNFKEEIESLSGLVFQNLGPAYMKELIGNSGMKLYDLETYLKNEGAHGVLILPDPIKNSLKLRLPLPYRKLGEELLRKVLASKQAEALRKNIVNIPYSKGMVLVVNPGALVSDIMYSDTSFMYSIDDMRSYNSYNEALLDLQNTFSFYQFNLVRKNNETSGILYFSSESQALEAQNSLKTRPLLGKNGPIFELKKIEKQESQPCLRISAGLHPKQLQTMLEYYGDFRYMNIKAFEDTTIAYVRYISAESTNLCINHFKQ